MRKLAQPAWRYILEAAKEFHGKPFTSSSIIDKAIRKAPRAKSSTIYSYLYGMTPNYPSNEKYPRNSEESCGFCLLGKWLLPDV